MQISFLKMSVAGIGGYDNSSYSDDILEFDPLTGQWELVDRMIQTREGHAVSVTTFESGLCV